jgi:hypothetical protein
MKPTYETRKPLIVVGQGDVSELTRCDHLAVARQSNSRRENAAPVQCAGVSTTL